MAYLFPGQKFSASLISDFKNWKYRFKLWNHEAEGEFQTFLVLLLSSVLHSNLK